jgi:gamma-glutamyltranspeptidase/glutathione hydrolase
MHIMDGWDVKGLGFNTPDYLDRMIRAANRVFQDRLAYIGDEDYVEVPLAMLLSAERADEHRAAIEKQIAAEMPSGPGGIGPGSRDTTHVSVIDEDENIVLITHSIGSGSGVVTPGLGFLHNNHMIQFDPRPGNPNSIAPTKHPNVGGGPVLALRDGELFMAMGSPAGGAKATAMAQVLASIVDFGKAPAEAAFLDRFHAEDVPGEVTLDTRFEPRAATALGQRGYNVNFSDYGARVAGIYKDPDTGALVGLVDPRGDRGLAEVASGKSR